ncbi:MAG: helix-hairpin-helix domain-containing protein [Actinomycetales bacterium]|nr:helix-hairpin-helix domain-containing protein [Actinomycetales bacterium]
MQLANSRNLVHRGVVAARAYVKRRPWLLLFALLLGVFTAIGSNSLAAASSERVINTPAVSASPGLDNALELELPQVYVHVVGEVKQPGLYVVGNDARLVDAIALAGGFTAKAEQSSVNLARTLTDGEQIIVLSKAAAAGGLSAGVGGAAGGSAAKVSLNRASQSELESLPRVGPALAGRIMDWRTANGGFKTIEDLMKVSGFGDKMFAAVKGLVIL